MQRTNSYNEVLSYARDQFCPLVAKDIIIKDDAPWCNHMMVSLRRQRRKAAREWRRLRTDSSRTKYVAARQAVVKQIFVCKVEYYNFSWPLLLVIIDAHSSFLMICWEKCSVQQRLPHLLKLSFQLVSLPSLTPKLTASEVRLTSL